ncbi:MAG: multicopper oxidase domain-containing protein [Chloroflexota bacterium]
MQTRFDPKKLLWPVVLVAVVLFSLGLGREVAPATAQSGGPADGIICTDGPTFNLNTRTGYVLTPDGNVVYMWGYSAGNNAFQHPSPVLCVNEGDTVTVILHNSLPYDVSISFPGQENVFADGQPVQPQFSAGVLTSLTNVAPMNGGSVTYTFVASRPGTFLYQSGTDPAIQVRMGLFGALIVRPAAGPYYVYNDAASANTSEFNHAIGSEVMTLQSEIDPYLNQAVEQAVMAGGGPISFNMANYHPRYWFVNGRGFPDTIAPNFASWLPSQPYGALVHIEPNSPANPLPYLERFLNVTSQATPFHPHGKNGLIIGQDGNPLRGSAGEDLSYETFALVSTSGQTYEALFRWYNKEDYSPSNPITVTDPGWQNLQFGPYYSGSPYLGQTGPMPPGFSSMSQCGEYYIISHNHALYQLTSWGVPMTGPGTFMRVDPPGGCP